MLPESPHPLAFDDTWAVANATLDGSALVLRFRQRLQPLIAHPQLPNRLHVVWLYDSEPLPGSPGMPSGDLRAEMDRLEDALSASFEPRGIAILTTVATGMGKREWTWYCCARELVQTTLNEALASLPRFPLGLSIASDPDWVVYRQFLKDVGAAA